MVEYKWQNLDVTPRSPASQPILMRNLSLYLLRKREGVKEWDKYETWEHTEIASYCVYRRMSVDSTVSVYRFHFHTIGCWIILNSSEIMRLCAFMIIVGVPLHFISKSSKKFHILNQKIFRPFRHFTIYIYSIVALVLKNYPRYSALLINDCNKLYTCLWITV